MIKFSFCPPPFSFQHLINICYRDSKVQCFKMDLYFTSTVCVSSTHTWHLHDWTWIDQNLTGVIRQRNRIAFSLKKKLYLSILNQKRNSLTFISSYLTLISCSNKMVTLSKWNEINLNKPAKFPQWDPSLSPNCNNKISMTVL